MNIWRMKLRAGSHGQDMWPQCHERQIASMTHPPILNTDLTHLSPNEVSPEVKTTARSSIKIFAWEMRGGDIIYVGDSKRRQIIAKGYVGGKPGERAYRYNDRDAITPEGKPDEPWRHEVPVVWDDGFEAINYRDHCPLVTVSRIEMAWLEHERDPQPTSVTKDLLNDSSYKRMTSAAEKNVIRLHSALSNRFRVWASRHWSTDVHQENDFVDATLTINDLTVMVEFKICYGANTRKAIREALGQMLEYNHYPNRIERDVWWLVLDNAPSREDLRYIQVLRQKYSFPLSIGWEQGDGFCFLPALH